MKRSWMKILALFACLFSIVPAAASAQTTCSSTNQIARLGLEVGDIQNVNGNPGGADWLIPIKRDILVTGVHLHISLGFPLGTQGWAIGQDLAYGYFSPNKPIAGTNPDAEPNPGTPNNNDFGRVETLNPNGFGMTGSGTGLIGGSNEFFSINQKVAAGSAGNDEIDADNLNLFVPGGWWMVIHVDSFGPLADFELQGFIIYQQC